MSYLDALKKMEELGNKQISNKNEKKQKKTQSLPLPSAKPQKNSASLLFTKPTSIADFRMIDAAGANTTPIVPTNPVLRGLSITSRGIQGGGLIPAAIDRVADILPDSVGKYLQDPTKVAPVNTAERVMQAGSELAGSFLPISGIYAGVSKIPALAKLGTYGQAAAKGALSGGIFEGARSAAEGEPLPDIAKNAAIGAVGWGAGDVALKGAGSFLKAATDANKLNRIRGLSLNPPHIQQSLGLPAGQEIRLLPEFASETPGQAIRQSGFTKPLQLPMAQAETAARQRVNNAVNTPLLPGQIDTTIRQGAAPQRAELPMTGYEAQLRQDMTNQTNTPLLNGEVKPIDTTIKPEAPTQKKLITEPAEEAALRQQAEELGYSWPLTTQQRAEVRLNNLMGELQRPVAERSVAPLESTKQLVNFVYEGLGGDISKNEIRKMSYDDLADMAQSIIKQNPSIEKLAEQEAAKRGVDLQDLFNTATNPEHARWKEVVGLESPPPKPLTPRQPVEPTAELNNARNILKATKNTDTAQKIFNTYPQLRKEFTVMAKRVDAKIAKEQAQAGKTTATQGQVITGPTEGELNAARSAISRSKNPDRVSKVLEAFPELQGEFRGWKSSIEAAQKEVSATAGRAKIEVPEPPAPNFELNAARNILKNTKNEARRAKIVEAYPQLAQEAQGQPRKGGKGRQGVETGQQQGAATKKGTTKAKSSEVKGEFSGAVDDGVQAMASPGGPVPTGGNTTGTVKRRDIIKFLDDKLNVPIRTGRFKQKALGIFKIKPEVVRTRMANDLPVISHEVGHYLDKQLGLANPAFDSELMALGSKTSRSSYTPGQVRKEGVAEFMRLFLTDEQAARQAAPKYFNMFEQKIKASPEIEEALRKAQQDIYTWYNQPAKARVLGSMSISEKEQKKTTLGRLYSLFIDEIDPLKSVSKMSGTLTAEKDPYKLAWIGRGWVGKAETLLNKGVLDANGNKIGNSLKEILKPVEKNLDDFRAYAVAKHAQEINSYGMKSGLTDADIAEVLQNSPAEYQQVLDELVKYQDNLLEMLADAGVISRGSITSMRQKYPNYVPFYRSFADDPNAAIGFLGKGYANLRSPVKKMTGSDRDILDPLESIIKNTYLFSNIAAKNKVGQAVAELANTTEGIGRLVEKVEGARSGKENVLDVWNNGELEHYQVQPDLYRAITSLDQESANLVIKLMSYPAQALRAGAVLSPDFMVRNPARDQFSAFINSKYGYLPIVDLVRGVFHTLKKDDLYWQWLDSGGGMSTMVSMDRDYMQQGLKKILRKSMGDRVKSLGSIQTYLEPLRYLSELMEQGTRLGEFRKGIKSGASPFEAALSSRDVTLDFARAGSKMKNWNRISAFLNASVQGMDKMVRQFDPRNPKQALSSMVKTVTAITLPSVLLYGLNKDDPRYQELPQWEKDLFWIIPTEKHLYRVPKPFELGVLFGSIPERVLSYIETQDPEAFKGLGETLKTFIPNILPTAANPALENKANYSFFRDRPIVPQREQKLPAEMQYGPQTTEAAKAVGKALNVSPRKVENAVQGYTGGLGMYALKAGNLLPNNNPKKPALSVEEYPVLKSFMQKPYVSSQSVEDFYNELDKMEKQYSKQKETGERQEGFNMGQLRKLRRVSQQLSDIRKRERQIQDSKTLSPQQKKQQLDIISKNEMNKVRAALKRPTIK